MAGLYRFKCRCEPSGSNLLIVRGPVSPARFAKQIELRESRLLAQRELCGKIPAVVVSVPRSAGRFRANGQYLFSGVPKMKEPEQLSIIDQSEVANLSQTEVQFVQADLVRMYQTDAEVVTADEVELRRSAVGNLKASQVTARKSALANVSATDAFSERSAMGYVQAEKASVSGYTGAVVAGSAEVRGITGLVAGNDVHVEGGRTFLLIGRNVTGSVVTLMDSRSALIAGLTGGLFAGLMFLLGRVLSRRK